MGDVLRLDLGNAIKLLSLFKQKGLLCKPAYYLLKDSLFGPDSEVLNILEGYDLSLLAAAENINTLIDLFNKLEDFAMKEAQKLLNPFFDDDASTNAHQIANATSVAHGDVRNKGEGRNFVYGEIEYDSFCTILNIAMVGIKGKKKFVDLGAGLGKACLWVALTTSFEEILGIEVIEDLVNQSEGILSAFQRDMKRRDLCTGSSSFNLVHGDFLSEEYDWEEADLIFANSTCFTAQLMMKLSVKSQVCKTGTRFITFTSSLDSPYWKVIYKQQLAMSWGPATVFVHERLSPTETTKLLQAGINPEECEEEDSDSAYELVDENVWRDGNSFENDDFVVL